MGRMVNNGSSNVVLILIFRAVATATLHISHVVDSSSRSAEVHAIAYFPFYAGFLQRLRGFRGSAGAYILRQPYVQTAR